MNSNKISESTGKLACPTCGRRFYLDETDSPPFCSQRCKMVDLGRWLGEEYGLPYEGSEGEAPEEYTGRDD